MAVVEVKPAATTWRRDSSAGIKSVTVEHLVKTDDIQDGPDIIRADAAVPKEGDTYAFGNEVDTSLYAWEQRVERLEPTANFSWRVYTVYMAVAEPDPNPDTWRDRIICRSRIAKTPVALAENTEDHIVRDWETDAVIETIRPQGTVGPMTTSAGAIIYPQEPQDAVFWEIEITKIQDEMILSTETPSEITLKNYQNKVNNDTVHIDRDGFRATFFKDRLRMIYIGGRRNFYPQAPDKGGEIGRFRYSVTYLMWWREDPTFWPTGWIRSQLDAGFEVRAYPNQKNSTGGGSIAPAGNFAQVWDGHATRISIVEPLNGQRLQGLSLLKNGNVIDNIADTQYLGYREQETVNMAPLPIFDTVP